jgi:cyanate permease
MRGKWLLWVRRTHLFLGVFFSPMLLFFIVTGWWQTVTSDDEKEREGGFLHELIKKLSNVHTDGFFPRANDPHYSVWIMKSLVVTMCVALILLTLLGLLLAWKSMKSKWIVLLAFSLGILFPALVLYLD